LQLPKNLLKSEGKRMMLKKFRCLVLAMVLILVVVSSTTFAAKKKPIKLILGHVFATDHYNAQACLDFKKLVEKNSKGQIIIDVFPAHQLGDLREMYLATQSGSQQMFLDSLGGLSPYYPKFGTFLLPYLVQDKQHYFKLLKKARSIIDEKDMAQKTGMSIVSCWARAPRQLMTNFPVNKLNDIKGLKIRVPEHPIYLAFWKALGAIPTPIPIGDLYTALATGTVDALENCLSDIWTFKLYEQQKYLAFTTHMWEVCALYINNKTWSSFTSAQKKILTDAANKCGDKVLEAVINGDKEYTDKMIQKGIKVTYPVVAPFAEKARTIWGQFGDAELIKKIQKLK
jgi:tripartite ATP-independent transporter DctP family solute receptor